MSPSPSAAPAKTHATGPRTAAGKASSSRNALRHGLASAALLIPGESPAAYEALLTDLTTEWSPASPTERLLVEDLAKHHWLKDRALRLQSETLALAPAGQLPPTFFVLLRYQTTNERAFSSALRTLQALQKARQEFVSQNDQNAQEMADLEALTLLTAPQPTIDFAEYLEKLRTKGFPTREEFAALTTAQRK